MKSVLVAIGFIIYSISFAQSYSKDEKEYITSGNTETALAIFNVKNSSENSILLRSSKNAPAKNKFTKILVERMKLALLSTDGGVGIAAPQVGINRNIIWVQRFDKRDFPLEYFINPRITWKSDLLQKGPEGDLSIDDFREQFYRSYSIALEYEDLFGKKHLEHVEGFTAVIFQHEIDHLSGVLITDKFEKEIQNKFKEITTYTSQR